MSYPIYERKWIIQRFINQKEKENTAMENARKNAKKR